MNEFTYQFSPLGNDYSHIVRIDHEKSNQIEFEATVSDQQILAHAGRQVTSLVADLMDIGGAVIIADRFTPRRQHQGIINIELRLRNPQIFDCEDVIHTLGSALYHYTNDQWNFRFLPSDSNGRIAEQQQRFFARSENEANVDVALFSGGVDALAGLAHQLHENPDIFFSLVSIGTGNPRIHNVQTSLARLLFQSEYGNRIQHVLVDTPRRKNRQIKRLNLDYRARAFAFLVIGSAFALLEEQNALYVYENGVGAINLPFRASEVGLDHSRTVHPLSLKRVSDFISAVIGQQFSIHNPFLFHTKMEITQGLLHARLEYLVPHTISCDRVGRSALQCGTCSSCLLRRQAMQLLEIADTDYALDRKHTHLRHMMRQVETLQGFLDSQDPWTVIAQKYPSALLDIDIVHEDLGLSRDDLHERIIRLYERYVDEWQQVRTWFEPEMSIGTSYANGHSN